MLHHRNHTESSGIESIGIVHSMLLSSVWLKSNPSPINLLIFEKKHHIPVYDTELIYRKIKRNTISSGREIGLNYVLSHMSPNKLKYQKQCSKPQENQDLLRTKHNKRKSLKKEIFEKRQLYPTIIWTNKKRCK